MCFKTFWAQCKTTVQYLPCCPLLVWEAFYWKSSHFPRWLLFCYPIDPPVLIKASLNWNKSLLLVWVWNAQNTYHIITINVSEIMLRSRQTVLIASGFFNPARVVWSKASHWLTHLIKPTQKWIQEIIERKKEREIKCTHKFILTDTHVLQFWVQIYYFIYRYFFCFYIAF